MRSERRRPSSLGSWAFLLGLLGVTLVPQRVEAASEDLARCNRTRAMALVGIPVVGAEASACSNVGRPSFSHDEASLRTSIGRKGNALSFPASSSTRPSWMDPRGGSSARGPLYGVGSGATIQDAFREATLLLAGQLSTTVYAQSNSSSVAATGYVSSSTGAAAAVSAGVAVRADTARIIISGALQHVRVTGVFQDPSSRVYHVQVTLDPRDAERETTAAGEAGFEVIARATGRFVQVVEGAGLTEDAVRVLLDAQRDLALLGRSPWGRSGASRWRTEERELRRLVEYLQGCAEVRLGSFRSPDPSIEPIAASATEYPPLIAQNVLVGRLVCGEQPLRGIRFRVTAEGGMASFPDLLRTGVDGEFELNIEAVRGSGQVRLVLRPQYTDGEYTRGGAIVGMTSTRSANYRIEVRGVPAEEAGGLLEAVRAMAVRRWNAREVAAGSPPVRCVIQVDVPSATAVMGRISQPISLSVSFTAEQGAIFERRHQSAFLAGSAEEARRGAVASLESVVQSW